MEALSKSEDKWKLSTQEAVLVLASTAVVLVCLCAITILKRRARARPKQLAQQTPEHQTESEGMKQAPVGSVRWSKTRKWKESPLILPDVVVQQRPEHQTIESEGVKHELVGSVRWSKTRKWRDSPTPLLKGKGAEGEVGWGSHNSDSPVWQRPILMGEKCEFPNFSGLILYDQKGRPVFDPERETIHQEMKVTVERTTLRDLL